MIKKNNKKGVFRLGVIALLVCAFSVVPFTVFPDTAKAETAQVKIAPEYRQTTARSMLPLLNNWRAGNNWYYSPTNTKLYVNGLKALTYDYTLEQYAMQRAAEIAISFDHLRPKGDTKTGIPGYSGFGENIAATTNVKGATADYGMVMFKEEDKPYSGQGHRRMMLSGPAAWDAVGISCVYYKGCYYWVQTFATLQKGKTANTTATTAVNGNKTITVDVEPSLLTSRSADLTEFNNWTATLDKGQTDYLPQVVLRLSTVDTWPHALADTVAVPAWTSSNTGVVTVNSDRGTITGLNTGTTGVNMKETLTGTNKSKTVTVIDPNAVTGVTLDRSTLSVKTGTTSTLKATVAPSTASNKNVTWSSSNSAVATVSSSGVITAVKAGTATITAKTVSGGKTASCKVTVSDVAVTGVALNMTNAQVAHKGTIKLTPTVSPSNATNKNVTWSSGNTSVATVDSSGTVTGVSPGTAVITVKTASGSKTATCTVTVAEVMPSGVSISPDSVRMTVGASKQLEAVITPSDASNKSVRWSSSDPTVASVSSNGVVTANKAGTADITVTTVSGNRSAVCTVDVTAFFTHKGEPLGADYTGIAKNAEGVSVYVENGSFDGSYTGLAKYTNGIWYYVENGIYKSNFSGMTTSTNGKYYYVKKGKWDKTYTGLAKSKAGKWYYVVNGTHNTSYVGISKSTSGTGLYFARKGTYDTSYTGLAKYSDGKWYYVKKGIHVTTYTGTSGSTSGSNLFYVKNGMWDNTFTGLAKHSDGKWHYFNKGQKNTSYEGISTSTSGSGLFYVKNGLWNTSYTGLAKYTDGKWYYVAKGKHDPGYTGLAGSTSDKRLYYVKNGLWDKTFTGYVNDSSGTRRYVKSGIAT